MNMDDVKAKVAEVKAKLNESIITRDLRFEDKVIYLATECKKADALFMSAPTDSDDEAYACELHVELQCMLIDFVKSWDDRG